MNDEKLKEVCGIIAAAFASAEKYKHLPIEDAWRLAAEDFAALAREKEKKNK